MLVINKKISTEDNKFITFYIIIFNIIAIWNIEIWFKPKKDKEKERNKYITTISVIFCITFLGLFFKPLAKHIKEPSKNVNFNKLYSNFKEIHNQATLCELIEITMHIYTAVIYLKSKKYSYNYSHYIGWNYSIQVFFGIYYFAFLHKTYIAHEFNIDRIIEHAHHGKINETLQKLAQTDLRDLNIGEKFLQAFKNQQRDENSISRVVASSSPIIKESKFENFLINLIKSKNNS